jgi:hypothetical protein
MKNPSCPFLREAGEGAEGGRGRAPQARVAEGRAPQARGGRERERRRRSREIGGSRDMCLRYSHPGAGAKLCSSMLPDNPANSPVVKA